MRQFIERKRVQAIQLCFPAKNNQPKCLLKRWDVKIVSYRRFVFTATISTLSWIIHCVAYVNIAWFLDVWKRRTCALRKKSSVEFIHLSLIQCMKIVSKLQGDTRLKMMAAKLFWDRMFTARCHIHFPRVHIAIKSSLKQTMPND